MSRKIDECLGWGGTETSTVAAGDSTVARCPTGGFLTVVNQPCEAADEAPQRLLPNRSCLEGLPFTSFSGSGMDEQRGRKKEKKERLVGEQMCQPAKNTVPGIYDFLLGNDQCPPPHLFPPKNGSVFVFEREVKGGVTYSLRPVFGLGDWRG